MNADERPRGVYPHSLYSSLVSAARFSLLVVSRVVWSWGSSLRGGRSLVILEVSISVTFCMALADSCVSLECSLVYAVVIWL